MKHRDLEAPELSDGVFELLRGLIHQRVGLFYDEGKREMVAGRLGPLVVRHCPESWLDYYYLLKASDLASDEWRLVMDALAVPETYFWREMDAVRALVDTLLPAWVAAHPGETAQIWSIPCATGEEPLTLALALDAAGWFQRVPITITGSDASPALVAQAQQGIYRERSLRALPPALRESYFRPAAGGWEVARELHRRITWTVANVMSASDLAAHPPATFIFCRNLFIYFSPTTTEATAVRLAARLAPGGALFIGVSESLLRLNTTLELREVGNAFVYVKRASGPTRTQSYGAGGAGAGGR